MDPLRLEQAVANWLSTIAQDLLVQSRSDAWPDFKLRMPDGQSLLIELKTQSPPNAILEQMAQRLARVATPGARFVLATPEPPSPQDLRRFGRAFKATRYKADWVSLEDLASLINRPSPGSWLSSHTWADLESAALTANLVRHRGLRGPNVRSNDLAPSDVAGLSRQFSYQTISDVEVLPGSLEKRLGAGSRQSNVTVVLTDLRNFSDLVSHSGPDALNQAMATYYGKARKAVFENGGMLDKFIGDAILAVFGYPVPTPHMAARAIQFAQAVIRIGQEVLADWQAEMNAEIQTGTRVGIATGDIWPLNIGTSAPEITLLGDTINLAARLEKNCDVDSFLIDNKTYTACRRQDEAFLASLSLTKRTISTDDAKGQRFPIAAWSQKPATPSKKLGSSPSKRKASRSSKRRRTQASV